MTWQFTPFTIPLILTAVLLLFVVIIAIQRRDVHSANTFILLMLSITVWTAFYALEISSATQASQIFWAKLEYLGIASVPVLWLMFALDYTRQSSRINRLGLLLLWIYPTITILLTLTNDYHRLIWSSFGSKTFGGAFFTDYFHGPAFWAHTAYSYLLLALGSIIFIRQTAKGGGIYETQSAVMLLGATLPWLANIATLFGLNPVPAIDLTPFALVLSGVFYGWGLFRLGLLELMPVASEVVLENLRDGVLVLDNHDRVVYLNPAFQEYSGVSSSEAIGWTARELLSRWPELVDQFKTTINVHTHISVRISPEDLRRFEMRISPLFDNKKRFSGRVIILRELTRTNPGAVLEQSSRISDATGMIMVLLRSSGEIAAVNDLFTETFSFTRREVIGRSASVNWWSNEQRVEILKKCRMGGIENAEMEFLTKDNQRKRAMLSANSMNVNGEPYIVLLMQEIIA
jgi:PAS domain S-box-containing protein